MHLTILSTQNETFDCFCEPGNLKLHNIDSHPAPGFYEKEVKPHLGSYSTERETGEAYDTPGQITLSATAITHEAAEMLPSKNFQKIRKFRQYRLALADIGRDLCAFFSVKEFVKAIRDATKGKSVYKPGENRFSNR